MNRALSLEELALDLVGTEPTDIELLDALVEYFDLTREEMVRRMSRVDFAALWKGLLHD